MKKLLISLTALGVVAATLTSLDIFAAVGDITHPGRFGISSGTIDPHVTDPPPPPKAVDLQIATYDGQACGTFTDDLDITTPVTMPGDAQTVLLGDYCVKNVGPQPAKVDASPYKIQSYELACTPGEEAIDNSCTASEFSAGEIERATNFNVLSPFTSSSIYTDNHVARPIIASLGVGDTIQVRFTLSWISNGAAPLLAAQSDYLILGVRIDGEAA